MPGRPQVIFFMSSPLIVLYKGKWSHWILQFLLCWKHMDPVISCWILQGSWVDPGPDPANLVATTGTRMRQKRTCKRRRKRTCMTFLPCSVLVLQAVAFLVLQLPHTFGKAIAKPIHVAVFVDFVAASLQTSSVLFPCLLPALRWSSPSQSRSHPRHRRLVQQNILHCFMFIESHVCS